MTDLEWLTPKIQEIAEKSGEGTLFIVSLGLVSDYFNIFKLTNLWDPLPIILWIYLIANIGLANFFKYLREKDNPNCPRCKRKLQKITEYKCPKCGKLKFGDKD